VIDDPAIVMLWGITRENLDSWLIEGSEGDPNELKGFAPARAWSKALPRVVKSVAEIGRIKQGDILVCQVTNPTWSPIFQKIGARFPTSADR
jgi:pyruvate,water dikinase